MLKAILGTKVGMTRIFDGQGNIVPVTVLACGDCFISQVKTKANDGYDAVQMGCMEAKVKQTSQSLLGHFKKAAIAPLRHLKEFRVDKPEEYKAGQKLSVEIFKPGDWVDVSGISKGKGFAGVVKRHKFRGGPKTHGQSDRHRHAGSVGSTTFPARVLKGLRMAGRMGGENVTVQKIEVAKIDPEKNLILLRGCVPGVGGGCIAVCQTLKKARPRVVAVPVVAAAKARAKTKPAPAKKPKGK